MKESHAYAGNAMLAEKTAKANGEFTVQDVEVIRQTVRRLKENGSTLFVVDVLLTQTWQKEVHMLSRYKDAMTQMSGEEKKASREDAENANVSSHRYHGETRVRSPEREGEQNIEKGVEREQDRKESAKEETR